MFRTLDIHPAFGFESVDRWKVACHQRDEFIRKEKLQLLGYHRLWGDSRAALNNFSKIAACIPGVNIIVGISRIILCAKENPKLPLKQEINARHIRRGFLEIFLGPLLLVIDMIQTIRDRALVKTYLEKYPHVKNYPLAPSYG